MKPSTPPKSSGQSKPAPHTASTKPMSAKPTATSSHSKPSSGKK